MSEWFETNLGASVVKSELQRCINLIPSEYYARGMQIGMVSHNFLENSSVANRYFVKTPTCSGMLTDENGYFVSSDPSVLPFPERSQNLVVLPHTLDFCSSPHEVLRQINQILSPEGCLVVSGFNVSSFYGLSKALRNKKHLPWCGSFYSVRRVQDWLSLLGYDLVGASMIEYQLPLQSEIWRNRMRFLESVGDRWWPGFGGIYIIVGRKKEIMVRPIGTQKTWQRLIPGMARPASASQKAAKMGIRLVKG